MLSNMRIGTRLALSLLMVALIGTLVGGLGIQKIQRLSESSDTMSEKMIYPMGLVSRMSNKFQQAKGKLSGIVYTTDPQQQKSQFAEFDLLRGELGKVTADFEKTLTTEAERKGTADFVRIRQSTDESVKKMMALDAAGKKAEAIAVLNDEVQKGASQMQEAMDKLVAEKEAALKQTLAANREEATTAKLEMSVLLIVSFLLSIGFGIFMTRSIVKPLRDAVGVANRVAEGDLSLVVTARSSDEVGLLMAAIADMVSNLRQKVTRTVDISEGIAAASNQLNATSEQIARGAEEVATQAGTVASASQEMSSTSVEIARNCTMAAEVSRQSIDAANAGAAVVHETILGMSVIADRVRQTSSTIEALGSRSQEIGNIIGTIEDIADQTNLLALNAAIEAARAGEQGRGFAVVADEVRALAERTTKATREIGVMIKAIQSETQEAVKTMEDGVQEVEKGALSSQESGQALENILGRISEVSMQISQIATAAEEQTATTNEVTMNVQQINQVVGNTARGAEETAAAAAHLAGQSRALKKLMSDFKVA